MLTTRNIFPSRSKAGDLGIEIEVETAGPFNVQMEEIPNWDLHPEGSIKGYGTEFVIRTPCKRKHLEDNLDLVYKCLRKPDVDIIPSQNTSVHVHVNVQKLSLESTVRFALYYILLEPIICRMLDEHRIGNVFCLQSEYTDYSSYLRRLCLGKAPNQGECKYGSLNLGVVKKFGTLEFRALQFPCTQEEITDWVDILLSIRNTAEKVEAIEFLNNLSLLGVVDLVREYVPELSKYVTEEDQDRVLENMYPYQELIYNYLGRKDYKDWDDYYENGKGIITETYVDGINVLEREETYLQCFHNIKPKKDKIKVGNAYQAAKRGNAIYDQGY